MAHAPTLVPVRVLDALHSYVELVCPSPFDCPFSVVCHQRACATLGAACQGSSVPVQRAVSQYMALPPGIDRCPLQIEGLQVYSLRTPVTWAPAGKPIYTDGSFLPDGGQAGCAVLMPDGTAFMARPPGAQSIYKAEMLAVLIACHAAQPNTSIFSDSLGVIQAISGHSPRVTLARWIHRIRHFMSTKCLSLSHVRGHTGEEGNELADKLAKRSCRLPIQPAQFPTSPWHFCFKGERVRPPHKTWARALIPQHANKGIHPISWNPLRSDPHKWVRWLFGVVDAPGFASHFTFWHETLARQRCVQCSAFHNRSATPICHTSSPDV